MTKEIKPYSQFNFEHRGQELLSRKSFIRRLIFAASLSLTTLLVWVLIGMMGYHELAGLGWVDSFLNTAMIVGGMGPVDFLKSDAAKIFAGFYAIFSGVLFLSAFALMAAPIFHRFLHKFHLEGTDKVEHAKKNHS